MPHDLLRIQVRLEPAGNLLAFASCIAWGTYNVVTKRVSQWGYPVLLTTRRVFLYGTGMILICTLFMDFRWDLAPLAEPAYLGNMLYLGLCAGALCFVTWNYGLQVLGAVKTAVYLYAIPVVSVVFGAICLGERMTPLGMAGVALTILGSVVSGTLPSRRRRHAESAGT